MESNRARDIADTDDQNLTLAGSKESVESLLKLFYGKYTFPWRTQALHCLSDPDFETVMLNQDVGDWTHSLIKKEPKIWVAGCGTNQAVITALRFPKATVLGCDLSIKSLEVCHDTAKRVGASNLTLKNESINDAPYEKEFDYIICTGVIHHNADPGFALSKLSNALKPGGILELMVYNRYHRNITSAFQKAIRILNNKKEVDFDADLSLAMKIIVSLKVKNALTDYFSTAKDEPTAKVADGLINPVEQSYTVDSLEQMAERCNLEMVAPSINIFDHASDRISWNMEFEDPDLQAQYDDLADTRRWLVANLLLYEQSPLLWFYLQRKDSGRRRKPEKEICEEFLDTKFAKNSTKRKLFLLTEDGNYKSSADTVPYPRIHPDDLSRKIINLVDGKTTMRAIFEKLGISPAFQAVNRQRLKLTTSAFPYLRAVQS